VRLKLRVKPGARRDAIEGEQAGALLVSVTAPADRGRANEAVVALLARAVGVPKSAISIRSGAASREKLLEIDGIAAPDEAGVRERLLKAGNASKHP